MSFEVMPCERVSLRPLAWIRRSRAIAMAATTEEFPVSADPSSSVRHGEVDRVPGAWFGVAAAAGLVSPTGQIATTIFAEMSALAARTGAINLGQGFPDEDGPAEVLEAAQRAIRDGVNQYPPGRGIPELLQAIAEHQHRFYGLEIDPAREALVTVGATEALTATLVALLSPGDEAVSYTHLRAHET